MTTEAQEAELAHCPGCSHRYGTGCGCPCCTTPTATDGQAVELDAVTAAWYQAISAWDAQIAELAEKRTRAVDLIKAAMGEATEARIGGRPVVSWKPSKPSEYIDAKALRAELPDVAARYTRLKAAARPFRILSGDS